jgi:predicted PurR-regulated permease PerM
MVFLLVVLFFAGVGWILVPPLVSEISKFAEHVPDYITQLQANPKIREWDAKYHLLEKAQQQLTQSNFQKNVANWALDVSKGTLSAIFNTLTVLILTLYFLSSLPQMKTFFYRLTPRTRRARVALLGDEILDRIGGYVAGNFIISIIAGVTTYIFLLIADIPYAAALALIIAVTDLIPLVGATIGAVIVSIIGFLTGIPEGIACVIFFTIYQQVENYLVAPRVMKRSVDVQPAVTVIAALIGAKLLGVVGALLAIPVAAAISLIVREVIHPRQDTL